MKIMALPLACLLLLLSCGEAGKQLPTVDSFNWLSGSWEMPMQGGRVTEDWKRVNDSLMEGRSDFVMGDSITAFETVQLIRRGAEFFYEVRSATQPEQPVVAFRLSRFSDQEFIAENPEHDFPKRIRYKKISADSIFAVVDGGPADSLHKDEFAYSRKK